MKLNMKYCVIGLFLISFIVFSCLGNNLYEGLINENEVRENTYKSGTEHAKDQGEQYQNLIKNCHLNNKKIGLAVCDEETFKPFSELNFDFYKLLSVSINNKNLIEILKSKKKPIYISTGFKANDQKIKRCINLFSKKNKLILLHTPMSYKVSELNFEKINYLKKKFDLDVGYSNHNNDPKTLNFLVPFKPKSIFLYCKPSLKKNRVYPDDKHAFSFEELEKIKENYMYYSNLNKNKKIKKNNIFKNEIKK